MKKYFLLTFLFFGYYTFTIQAQIDSAAAEEDYSIYENATFSGDQNKTFCSPKIFDLSPQRFLSVAYDYQTPYKMELSKVGNYAVDENNALYHENATIKSTQGLRLYANIPIISKNKFLWQVGMNYWDVNYKLSDATFILGDSSVLKNLDDGLTSMGLHTTIFKPLNDKQFILFQSSADLSGNYELSDIQSLKYLRYSAAIIWGKRPNDRKQWGIGVARTYRVGELNYIPVFLYNWTSPSRKWGSEILFPARGHIRKNFNARNLLLAGYELEGQSYLINGATYNNKEIEIKRGELRLRFEYQRQLWGFIWGSVQAGYRYDWSYNADYVNANGSDFFRGFTGKQSYAMLNNLGGAAYFNIGIHLVSP